jgi:hypothetical protein
MAPKISIILMKSKDYLILFSHRSFSTLIIFFGSFYENSHSFPPVNFQFPFRPAADPPVDRERKHQSDHIRLSQARHRIRAGKQCASGADRIEHARRTPPSHPRYRYGIPQCQDPGDRLRGTAGFTSRIGWCLHHHGSAYRRHGTGNEYRRSASRQFGGRDGFRHVR